MSFTISEQHYPFTTSGTSEFPDTTVETFVVAAWNRQGGVPTTGEIMDAVSEMIQKFPGRGKQYRITGLPKPGDFLFGVEVA